MGSRGIPYGVNKTRQMLKDAPKKADRGRSKREGFPPLFPSLLDSSSFPLLLIACLDNVDESGKSWEKKKKKIHYLAFVVRTRHCFFVL